VWFVKSRRAQSTEDHETWIEGIVSPTLNAFDNTGEIYATVIHAGVGVRRLTPQECEILQGFPCGWTDGQSDRTRYVQLGNAVTVNVAEWIGHRLMEMTP
jgi:DNA (cytosine-5)-methyltransferase 1